MQLRDRIGIVTAGASGMGRAGVLRFAAEGAAVAVVDIDFLNGAVVRVAGEHGLRAPVNAALVELVHGVERTGAFVSPADVAARVPIA